MKMAYFLEAMWIDIYITMYLSIIEFRSRMNQYPEFPNMCIYLSGYSRHRF